MSLLSALLTQDQVVSPRKIDAAIQRQVISGGDFETNLLEVEALGEDTLSSYCAALLGLSPASRESVLGADPSAVARVSRELASRHQVVPLAVEATKLVVVAAANLDASARKALEAAAGAPVEVRAVTSFRLAWALWRYYQQALSPRFLRLSERLNNVAAGAIVAVALPSARASIAPAPPTAAAPPSKANSAIAALAALLDDDEDDEAPADEPPPNVTATRAAISPEPSVVTPVVAVAVARPEAVARSEAAPQPPEPAAPNPPGTRPSIPPPAADDQHRRSTVPVAVPLATTPPPATRPLPDTPVAEPPSISPRRAGSVLPALDNLTGAQRALVVAKDREEVIDALLTHAMDSWKYAALCVVQGDALEGLAARGAGADPAAVRSVAGSFKALPAFAAVKSSGDAAIVKLASDAEVSLARQLGREGVSEVALVPLSLRGRVTLMLWADLGAEPVTPILMRELSLFADDCAAAFARLIVERKRSSAPAPSLAPREPTLPPLSRPPRTPGPDREARAAALRSAVLAGVARRKTSITGASRGEGGAKKAAKGDAEADRLVEEASRTGTLSERTAATLLGMGDRALAALFRYFPGSHTLSREAGAAKSPSVEDAGPLLRLALMFRQAAVPALVEALDSDDADRRFCALMCLAEVAHPSALPRLSTLVLGDDEALHPVALEVLRAHRRFPEFAAVGATLRTALREPRDSALVRRRAASALGELRDVDAVPLLIAALSDKDGPLASAAQRSLVLITRQDFGTTAQHWVDWWSNASSRHRVQWLIDALLHVDTALRHEASEELKKLTGQFFGYYYNLPRRERERAHQKYVEWWGREGAERFAGRGGPEGR